MTEKQRPKKDDVYWKVLSSTIELDLRKGHQKWTLSELSRSSKVTRSLIYYYFGRSKIGILEEAIKIIGEELVGLNSDRFHLWEKGLFLESLQQARSFHEKAPYISAFVMANVRANNPMGDQLRKIEKKFLEKIRQFFPHLSQDQVIAIYTIYWGAVFCPLGNENSLMYVIDSLKKYF
ncbi:MAG: TetR/AcrR family transcriptional regulator [Bdellovibrionales bacterium]|nr:TetR/AcrR family transcriptional regulator [Bdellovibrionales bacterium]